MKQKKNESRNYLTSPEVTGFSIRLQGISPQRIPATVAPSLLLSPSMFTQTNSSSDLLGFPQESSPAPLTLPLPPQQHQPQEGIPVLTKSQLQATLLNLIQVELLPSCHLTSS